jgi:hypothetical protein
MACVRSRDSDAGDALDVGERRVAQPVGADAQLGRPRQRLDPSCEGLEPPAAQVATVRPVEDDWATLVGAR